MPIFNSFKGILTTMKEALRSVGRRKNHSPYEMSQDFIGIEKAPHSPNDSHHAYLAMYEAKHYCTTHTVYQVSKHLAMSLWKPDNDVYIDELKIPNHIFEVCFEKGFLIPKTTIKMPSFLCNILPPNANLDFEAQYNEDLRRKTQKYFTLEPADPTATYIYVWGTDPDCHFKDWIDRPEYDAESIMTSVIALGDNPLRLDKLAYTGYVPPNHKTALDAMANYVANVLSYINIAHHESERVKDHNRPKMGMNSPTIHLLGKSIREDQHAYMRKGSFRCLRHPRYKRLPDGRPQIIWVNEYLVNAGAKKIELPEKAKRIEEVDLFENLPQSSLGSGGHWEKRLGAKCE